MVKWKPAIGDKYYVPDPHIVEQFTDFAERVWQDSSLDNAFYKEGVICFSKDEAISLAEQTVNFCRGEYIKKSTVITMLKNQYLPPDKGATDAIRTGIVARNVVLLTLIKILER